MSSNSLRRVLNDFVYFQMSEQQQRSRSRSTHTRGWSKQSIKTRITSASDIDEQYKFKPRKISKWRTPPKKNLFGKPTYKSRLLPYPSRVSKDIPPNIYPQPKVIDNEPPWKKRYKQYVASQAQHQSKPRVIPQKIEPPSQFKQQSNHVEDDLSVIQEINEPYDELNQEQVEANQEQRIPTIIPQVQQINNDKDRWDEQPNAEQPEINNDKERWDEQPNAEQPGNVTVYQTQHVHIPQPIQVPVHIPVPVPVYQKIYIQGQPQIITRQPTQEELNEQFRKYMGKKRERLGLNQSLLREQVIGIPRQPVVIEKIIHQKPTLGMIADRLKQAKENKKMRLNIGSEEIQNIQINPHKKPSNTIQLSPLKRNLQQVSYKGPNIHPTPQKPIIQRIQIPQVQYIHMPPIEKIVERRVQIKPPPKPSNTISLSPLKRNLQQVSYKGQNIHPTPQKPIIQRIQIPQVQYIHIPPIEKTVERRVQVPVQKIVERRVQVPVQKIVERRVQVPVQKIVERRVQIPVQKIVERRVQVPVQKVVERRVQIPVQKIVEKKIQVPVYKVTQQRVQIPHLQVIQVPFPVQRIVQVPVMHYIEPSQKHIAALNNRKKEKFLMQNQQTNQIHIPTKKKATLGLGAVHQTLIHPKKKQLNMMSDTVKMDIEPSKELQAIQTQHYPIGQGQLRISWYEDKVDIRVWTVNKGQAYPTTKGVEFPLQEAQSVKQMINDQPLETAQKLISKVPKLNIVIITDIYKGKSYVGMRGCSYFNGEIFPNRFGFNLTSNQWQQWRNKYW